MQKNPKYLIVGTNELELATKLGEPVRAFQNPEMYTWFYEPRIFVEVTDSVKFKRDRMGRPKFVSSKLGIVPTKHSKSDANSGSRGRTGASKGSTAASSSRRIAERSRRAG